MKAVHLAIDYQKCFLWDFIVTERKPICDAALRFSQNLLDVGIPTLWIACSSNNNDRSYFYPEHHWEKRTGDYKRKLVKYGLPFALSDSIRPLFIKNHNNAFHKHKRGPALEKLLGHMFDTIIFSGLNTSLCIAESVQGALRYGHYRCFVAVDFLADGVEEFCSNDGSSLPLWLWNFKVLRNRLHPDFKKITPMFGKDIIAYCAKQNGGGLKPAAALK